MYFNQDKRKSLHKNTTQFPEDLSGTQSWPSFLCLGAQIWPPRRHVKPKNKNTSLNLICSHSFAFAKLYNYIRKFCVIFYLPLSTKGKHIQLFKILLRRFYSVTTFVPNIVNKINDITVYISSFILTIEWTFNDNVVTMFIWLLSGCWDF